MLSRLLLLVGYAASVSALASSAAAPMRAPAAAASSALARTAEPLMASVPVAGFDGGKTGEAEVSLKVAKAGAYVVHRKVVVEQANMRLGTAMAKTRAEVRGGGRKPYQQKGTGNARRGSTRSPLIVGGGKSFGPRVKSYRLKMNKKEAQLALSTALMGAVPRMTVVSDFESNFAAAKTADMKAFLDRLDVDTKEREGTMMIIKERHENTYLSARNIPYLNLRTLDNLNARDILKAKKVGRRVVPWPARPSRAHLLIPFHSQRSPPAPLAQRRALSLLPSPLRSSSPRARWPRSPSATVRRWRAQPRSDAQRPGGGARSQSVLTGGSPGNKERWSAPCTLPPSDARLLHGRIRAYMKRVVCLCVCGSALVLRAVMQICCTPSYRCTHMSYLSHTYVWFEAAQAF